jgi:hypothetical protein
MSRGRIRPNPGNAIAFIAWLAFLIAGLTVVALVKL